MALWPTHQFFSFCSHQHLKNCLRKCVFFVSCSLKFRLCFRLSKTNLHTNPTSSTSFSATTAACGQGTRDHRLLNPCRGGTLPALAPSKIHQVSHERYWLFNRDPYNGSATKEVSVAPASPRKGCQEKSKNVHVEETGILSNHVGVVTVTFQPCPFCSFFSVRAAGLPSQRQSK